MSVGRRTKATVAAFVLTGGNSTRMGCDKALLPVGSQSLCERIADVLARVADQVLLIGHPERYVHLRYPCVADIRPGLGPLSGLETALSLRLAEYCVVSSCDTYNLNTDWVRTLLAAAQKSGALCTVAQDDQGALQPLCAVYRRDCQDLVTRAISDRRLRAMDLLEELNAQPVRVSGMVLNLNTPEQYQELVHATARRN